MKKGLLIVRLLLGVMMIAFGANKFLHFMPMPEMAEPMQNFLGAIGATGYLMPLVAIVEIVAGITFVFNKFAALGAVILVPVMLNAFLAHLFLDPAGMGGALVAFILTIVLIVGMKDKYSKIFEA